MKIPDTIQPLILIITGVMALSLHMVYLLKDTRTPDGTPVDLKIKKHWHFFGGVLHAWMGVVIGLNYGVGWGVLMAAVMWLFFDGAVNSWVLNKEWWFIGNTAGVDMIQQSLANHLHEDPRVISATLKLMFLTAAIINIFV